MRWLFLGLIIINAIYFVWTRQDFVNKEQQPIAEEKLAQVGSGQVKLINEVASVSDKQPQKNTVSTPSEVMLLGGFNEEAVVQELQQRLRSLDIKSEVTTLDSQVDIEYWVYFEPLASRQASVRQLKELQARKIDGYLITQGDLANGISLGMFAREDSAQGVAERLSAAGYESSIRAVERSQRLYWVVIDDSARRLLDKGLLKILVEDFSNLKHLFLPSDTLKQ
ncbi:MAG TPA: SPOR domain-containing protein [Gammaproteobacteria bacterium]|nr:SPOR domain-containing protein [Gammaproteobacteria bacterium]